MKFISLIIALAIVAFIISTQIGGGDKAPVELVTPSSSDKLKVPTTPEGIPKFQKDLDAFVKEQAEERANTIEQAEK